MNKKRKMGRADRRLLKKAGFGHEHKDMGAPDLRWGRLLRKRVRRERWNRQVRVMRRFCQLGVIYLGCLAAVLLLVAGVYELVRRLLM